MRDPREALAHIRARAEKASPGPWYDEKRNLDEPYSLTTVYYGFHNGETPDRDLVAEATYDNAEFIAAARTDVPRLVDALEGVLALHRVINVPGAGGRIYEVCQDCNQPYPCRYAATVARALEGACPTPTPEEDA